MGTRSACATPDTDAFRTGRLARAVITPASPNFNARAEGGPWPDSIVLHYTGMVDGASAVAWLCNPASQVSCHYVVSEDGAILQLVAEEHRAWHAGRSWWAGVTDMNSASIGIEIVNGGYDFGLPDFPPVQIEAVAALCRDVVERHVIRPERVLAHSDIAPSRKRDPGELFPWARLHRGGVGHWVPAVGEIGGPCLTSGDSGSDVRGFQEALAGYGYGLPVNGLYDGDTETVVRAFQRHFRPRLVDGRADLETRATLMSLSAALGCAGA